MIEKEIIPHLKKKKSLCGVATTQSPDVYILCWFIYKSEKNLFFLTNKIIIFLWVYTINLTYLVLYYIHLYAL